MVKKDRKQTEIILTKLGIVEKVESSSKSSSKLSSTRKAKITVITVIIMALIYSALFFIAKFNATHNVKLFSIESFISIIISIIIVLFFCLIGIYLSKLVSKGSTKD